MRHIKGKDLNLLLVFGALWRDRNVTKAAQALGMTQPTLSRALGRLRVEFSDPLFVRAARGVVPTDRAVQLADTIVGSLETLDRTYATEAQFDPSSFQRVFNIITADYFEVIAAAELLPCLMKDAPGLTLNFRPGQGRIPKEAMERGDVDLVILGIYEDLPEGFFKQKILTDRYRSAVRKGHPQIPISSKNFSTIPHALVTPKGDLTGIVDTALAKQGKKRRVAIASPNFLSAGWMVAHSDLVLSAPGLLIERLKEFLPLADFPTPVSIPHLELFQVWHARASNEPAQKWLRHRISEYCKGIAKN